MSAFPPRRRRALCIAEGEEAPPPPRADEGPRTIVPLPYKEGSAMRIEPSAPPKIHDSCHERPARRLLVRAGTLMLTAVASTGDMPASGPVAPDAKQRATPSYDTQPLPLE